MNKVLPAATTLWADSERVVEMDNLWASNERTPQVEALAYQMVRGIPHKSVLDLGCGSARYADAIKGWLTYVGVDLSPHMTGLAEERLARYPRRETELQNVPLGRYDHKGRKDYDLAICSHLAQHYERPLDFIRGVIDSAPAKHVLVSFVVHSQPTGTVDFKIGWEGEEDGSNIGSRSIAKADMDAFLEDYDVADPRLCPVWWHEDAKYWFALIRKG